jgi:two-component system, chemotaxis family, protein-glutamate methylesterase/glutaminase
MNFSRSAIRVLVIDDSPIARQVCTDRLRLESDLVLLPIALDPTAALRRISAEAADVIVVDIEMPRCNGVQIVRQIMQQCPRPIVVFSSLNARQADLSVAAMAAGAIATVKKPYTSLPTSIQTTSTQLAVAIREAAKAKVQRQAPATSMAMTAQTLIRQAKEASDAASLAARSAVSYAGTSTTHSAHSASTVLHSAHSTMHATAHAAMPSAPAPFTPSANIAARAAQPAIDGVRSSQSADVMLPNNPSQRALPGGERLIAIGSSTGGTQALEIVLTKLPATLPGIVIVQHMPEKFSAMFAQRLNDLCAMEVREAKNGDKVRPGLVLIAAGGRHMMVKRTGLGYHVEIADGPLVNRHKPSVDLMFRSVALAAGSSARGFILTGMGDDGARGMKELHEAGARNVAQDEASCVVFGMPKVAIALGGVHKIMPLDKIAGEIIASAVV